MSKKYTKPKFNFTYHNDYYRNYDTATNIPDIDMEFDKLMKEARRRIGRFQRSGISNDASREMAFLYNIGRDAEGKMAKARIIPDLARQLSRKISTVMGYRDTLAKQVRTLRDKGLTFINKRNIEKWNDFIEYANENEDLHKKFYTTGVLAEGEDNGLIIADEDVKVLDVKAVKKAFKEYMKPAKKK